MCIRETSLRCPGVPLVAASAVSCRISARHPRRNDSAEDPKPCSVETSRKGVSLSRNREGFRVGQRRSQVSVLSPHSSSPWRVSARPGGVSISCLAFSSFVASPSRAVCILFRRGENATSLVSSLRPANESERRQASGDPCIQSLTPREKSLFRSRKRHSGISLFLFSHRLVHLHSSTGEARPAGSCVDTPPK